MTEPVLSRRGFLSGIAGLVTVIAVDPVSLIPGMTREAAELSARERLLAMIGRNGIVENQTFVFNDSFGVVIEDVQNLIIRNCRFEWPNGLHNGQSGLTFGKGCDHITMDTCHIEIGPSPDKGDDYAAISINPNHPEPLRHYNVIHYPNTKPYPWSSV